jgi:uncharacterized membrane protein
MSTIWKRTIGITFMVPLISVLVFFLYESYPDYVIKIVFGLIILIIIIMFIWGFALITDD